MHFNKKHIINNKGFTLIELITVIAIIALLSAMLVLILGDYQTKAKISTANSSAKSYYTLINAYMADKATEKAGRNDGAGFAYYNLIIDNDGKHQIDTTQGEVSYWSGYDNIANLTNELCNMFDESITGVRDASVLLVMNKNRCITVLFSPTKVQLYTELGDGSGTAPSSKYINATGSINKSAFGDGDDMVDNIDKDDGSVLGYFS